MNDAVRPLPAVLTHSRVCVVFHAGALDRLGELAKEVGGTRVFLVSDPGVVRAGHAQRAVESLRAAGLDVSVFDRVQENPTSDHVDNGVAAARAANIDLLVGLGGGSAMDCGKGINFVLTNGGTMADYWGVGKATKAMLPMIAVPTTAGTGSEAQSFALICDPKTHRKMACGDEKAMCRAAILDPDLTRTQPPRVAAASAMDAVSHAVETAGTNRRNEVSLALTREAWIRLDRSLERALRDPGDADARADVLLGAHLAGAAIEKSMLGAAHACANPLTRRYGIAHGVAVGIMLGPVVRFNGRSGENPYAAICSEPAILASRIDAHLACTGLPRTLRDCGVPQAELDLIAEEAAEQWTAQFNSTPVGRWELLEILESAFG